jgi:hypothetical protein
MEDDVSAETDEARTARKDLLDAMSALESEMAAPASEESLPRLESSLQAVQRAFDEHKAAVQGPGGLLAELADPEPRMRSHWNDMRIEHSMIVQRARAIAAAIPTADHEPSLLVRIEALLAEISRHSEHLVTLAYEAVDIDIPAID